MVSVLEAKTKKQQKEFLEFPLNMYKDNPYFVPPLYADEKKIFDSDYVYYSAAEAVYFNAYKDGQMAGRISGIIQKTSNEKTGEKRVRFTRFDCIEDEEVAKALFQAVENWAREKGMDMICGPLGFSDFEREGLLIEGFDELSTYAEQYNAPYYGRLIENLGYQKEVDWLESKVYLPDQPDEKLKKMSELLMKRNNLHIAEPKNINEVFDRYGDQFFDLIDRTYAGLYGTVPAFAEMRQMLTESFKPILNPDYMILILNEKEELVCAGVCMPSISKALNGTKGKLDPITLAKLLYAIKKPEIIDLLLIAVAPEYLKSGVSAIVLAGMMDMLGRKGIKYAETNLNLEDNLAVRNQWKRFKTIQHKRRRSYLKML